MAREIVCFFDIGRFIEGIFFCFHENLNSQEHVVYFCGIFKNRKLNYGNIVPKNYCLISMYIHLKVNCEETPEIGPWPKIGQPTVPNTKNTKTSRREKRSSG